MQQDTLPQLSALEWRIVLMKIGYVTLLANYARPNSAPSYAEIRELTQQAEEAGFDSVWLYDHFLYRYPNQPEIGIWESWTMLAALAEATRRVEVGTLVSCTAFRNPALLAKMATNVDEISGSRFVLGLGAGWNRAEFEAFGVPLGHRVARFEEALQIIVPLLREGHVDFRGKYYQAVHCTINPRGPRTGGPPLLIGAKRPRMLGLTARYGDLWNIAYVASPAELADARANLATACEAIGRCPASLQITATAYVRHPDLEPIPSGVHGFLSGTTEQVAASLKAFSDAGVSHLMCHCIPNTPVALARVAAAVRLFGEISN